MSDVEKEITALVDGATDKKTFSIVDAISNRSYPHTTVNVFLNESLAFDASLIEEKISEFNVNEDTKALDNIAELQKQLDDVIAQLESEKYVFHVHGISEGERDAILASCTVKYPIEYDDEVNQYTGAVTKVEKDNSDRDRLFTILLWKAQIRKIVSPDGSVQESLTEADVEKLRTQLPIASIAEINNAIDKVRAATAVFMAKVNQDFLAKR